MSVQGSDDFKFTKKDFWGVYYQESELEDKKVDNGELTPDKTGIKKKPFIRGHAWMTYQSLKKMGLTERQAHEARSGNWQRDLSQAILPLFNREIEKLLPTLAATNKNVGIDIVFTLLNIMHYNEFEKVLTSDEFGSYDPIEHLDNPAGEYAGNVFKQTSFIDDENYEDIDYNNRFTSPKEGTEFYFSPYYLADRRYSKEKLKLITPENSINNATSYPFKIDENGLVVYIQATKQWIRKKLVSAAKRGKYRDDFKGPREFASAVHALQDYFFHSNSIEIAINILLEKEGKNFIDTFIYEYDSPQGNDSSSRKNLIIDNRQIVTTGTFATDDTILSIVGEIKDNLLGLNPFDGTKEPNGLTLACLDLLEIMAKDQLFQIANNLHNILKNRVIDIVNPIFNNELKKINNLKNDFSNELTSIINKLNEIASKIEDFIFSLIPDWLKGDQEKYKNEKEKVLKEINKLNTKIHSTNIAFGLFQEELSKLILQINDKSLIISTIYSFLTPDPLLLLKDKVKDLPLGENLVERLENIEDEINKEIKKLLNPIYQAVLKEIVEDILPKLFSRLATKDGTSLYHRQGKKRDKDLAKHTRIQNPLGKNKDIEGISCLGYWPPSHSLVAKDHPPVHSAAEDVNHHQHEGDWLHPIAEILAMTATFEAAKIIKSCWDRGGIDTEAVLQINTFLNKWISHPADNISLWEMFIPLDFREKPTYKTPFKVVIPDFQILIKKQNITVDNYLDFVANPTTFDNKINSLKTFYEKCLGYDNYITNFNAELREKMVLKNPFLIEE